jgi:hypothetical protein
MRLAAFVTIPVAVIVIAAALAGCQHSAAPDGATAARSRAEVVPVARELYQALSETSARSVELLDWGYQPCGPGTGRLSYGISMRLFAFAARRNADFEGYRQRVVRIVRAAGWTLRQRPPTRSVTLPAVPSAYYRLSRHDAKTGLTGTLALVGDENPHVGVSGTISLSGPCLDAGPGADSVQSHTAGPPFPLPSASR